MEVDLHYPKQLHKSHENFPLAIEKKQITFDMLSPMQQKQLIEMKGEKRAKSYKSEKLVATLGDKKKYIVHFKTLKLYLELGLKLAKVHRVLSFNQKPFFKPYIDLFTQKRKMAKDNFQKSIFKLFSNSLFVSIYSILFLIFIN